MADKSISFHKLLNIINANGLQPAAFISDGIESFHVVKQYKDQEMFIPPFLSEVFITDSNKKYDVLLISAPGATGKSMLTCELSRLLQIPVLNLSLHDPMGSYSLTGVLTRTMGNNNFGKFATQLTNGTGAVIIDGLDEGALKTTDMGYFAFLDDVVNFASNASGVPFVMLGRTNVVENTALYLDSKGLKVMQAQIEPFTEEQAKNYIDKHVALENRNSNQTLYVEARDYVIKALEGFFKNQNEINHNQFKQFIGYAPVLNAISTLFNTHRNYHKLLEDLRQGNYRNIDLLVEIITTIMLREKEDKIKPILLDPMLKNRDENFRAHVIDKAYSIEEQCMRLLKKELKETPIVRVSDDPNFNNEYNKNILSFADEHPFLDSSGRIQNIVFQSFVIATLINSEKNRTLVYRYLKQSFNNPYPLFDIYNKVIGKEKFIDLNFIPYLFGSLQSLDNKMRRARLEVVTETEDDGTMIGNAVFTKPGEKELTIVYSILCPENQTLTMLPQISNMELRVLSDIEVTGAKIELKSHVSIDCKNLSCSPSEIMLSSGEGSDNIIRLTCDNFAPDFSRTGNIEIINKSGNNDLKFEIISSNRLTYPFIDFHKEKIRVDLPKDLMIKFHKLKNIVGWFRSHSKGDLARYKELIDNVAVGNSSIGKSIIKKLIGEGILYTQESKYFIDNDKMNLILGVSRDDLVNGNVTEKVKTFLSQLD